MLLGLSGQPLVAGPARAGGGADDWGPLQPPDENGLRLPQGFRSRKLATSGSVVAGTGHVWHAEPDGGATFAAPDGGWVYVSNSELSPGGGVGAIRFASDGSIVDAYAILSGTDRNCAGGPTPWGTWLSCEEVPSGRVYECDPFAPGSAGVVRPALGIFSHEAAAVDPVREHVYLTEDAGDSALYRFTSSAWPSLSAGSLEVAEILDPGGDGPIAPGQTRPVAWHPLPNPTPASGGVQDAGHLPVEERATRLQVAAASAFVRGEGCWYAEDFVYFATTADSRVWKLATARDEIEILYDPTTAANPELSVPDNVFAAPGGDVYVAEDGGDLQIVALTRSGAVKPLLQLTGVSGTEITGPALSPDGRRLYFSSQRGPGVTFEVTGPFLGAVPLPGPASTGSGLLVAAAIAAAAWRLRRAAPAPPQAEGGRSSTTETRSPRRPLGR